ncbi:MAG: RelA/SpoT domain-containing protein [candidate division Zixibacteria bacterium]|nr:RelA/SpoT domain-containing protein [candidate division Zixibacteria bacterium]MDH3937050.1 RelA/SpoT domain-containing protein [candidate division Zixibacteria bacterium]MDH4034669.1 RelA/SpoT domain-containing protein [candidate division Zixibacteria bacterium]
MEEVVMNDKKRANIRFDLYSAFQFSDSCAKIMSSWQTDRMVCQAAEQVLEQGLMDLRAKSVSSDIGKNLPHGAKVFYSSNVRVKQDTSLRIKLFNKVWADCGFDESWPESNGDEYLSLLTSADRLKSAYSSVKDLLGGRLVLACIEDFDRCLDFVREYLETNEYKVFKEYKDFRVKPKRDGYYGCHLYVRVPSRGAPRFRKAELQIQTLLGNAWSLFGHDMLMKTLEVPGRQLLLPIAYRQMAGLSRGLQATDYMFGITRTFINES